MAEAQSNSHTASITPSHTTSLTLRSNQIRSRTQPLSLSRLKISHSPRCQSSQRQAPIHNSLVFSPLLTLRLILQGRNVLICILFWRKETFRELCHFICSPSLHATYLRLLSRYLETDRQTGIQVEACGAYHTLLFWCFLNNRKFSDLYKSRENSVIYFHTLSPSFNSYKPVSNVISFIFYQLPSLNPIRLF